MRHTAYDVDGVPWAEVGSGRDFNCGAKQHLGAALACEHVPDVAGLLGAPSVALPPPLRVLPLVGTVAAIASSEV